MKTLGKHKAPHVFLWYKPGDSTPKQWKLKPTMVSLIFAGGIIGLCAVVASAFFFSSYFRLFFENNELRSENLELRREVAGISQLEAELSELQQFSAQLKRSLTEGADLKRLLKARDAVDEDVSAAVMNGDDWVHVADNGEHASLDLSNFSKPIQDAEWPRRWPVDGFITRGFERPAMDPGRAHTGIDLAVPRGTPVRAVAGGIVIASDWTPRLGNRVIIDHGGGFISIYGHNELLLVKARQGVQAGTPVALSGNSGISTAPHLHFEIWIDAVAVDPRALLPERGGKGLGSRQ